MGNKKIVLLGFLFILCACKGKENKTVTRDVFLPQLYNASDTVKNRTDSIVLEYTDIDSITQFVRKINYHSRSRRQSDTLIYKLISYKTMAYVEFPYDTIKSIYLDTKTSDIITRTFKYSEDTIPPPPVLAPFDGRLQYVSCLKDSINNMSYYVFKGNDIGDSLDTDVYYYFDSIFHLKKVYSSKGILLFSVRDLFQDQSQANH